MSNKKSLDESYNKVLLVDDNAVVSGVFWFNKKHYALHLDKGELALTITENTFRDFEKLANL